MKDFTRRDFVKMAGVQAAGALIIPSVLQAAGHLSPAARIGSTFILWGYGPDDIEPALRDIHKLGFHGFETFGEVIEEWEDHRGGFQSVIARHGVPIISAFCTLDVVNPSQRAVGIKKLQKWSTLLKKNGGHLIEFCAGGADRKNYDYRDHKKNLIDAMNDYGRAVKDLGLTCALHPHTGTAIETTDEVYFAMEHVNTDWMRFGPDVGQLQKGGADPVKIVRDFLALVEHMHLKDYKGGLQNGWLGYCPLGEGAVGLHEILSMAETRAGKMAGMIMFELDSDGMIAAPMTPFVAARTSRDFLKKIGYSFDSQP